MKDFELTFPANVDEAIELLPDGGDWSRAPARLLAGGQDLLTEMKEHLVEPDQVVNLKRIPELAQIVPEGGGLQLGALVTLSTLESNGAVLANYPVVAEAAASVASPQIRTMATLGGNLCQRPRCWYYRSEQAVCLKKGGDECFAYSGLNKYNAVLGGGPSYIVHPSDMAPALIACDATLHVHGPDGHRDLPLGEFFTLPTQGDVTRENVLRPDEVLTTVMLPERSGWRSTYLKFREKGSFDFALSAVALALRMQGDVIQEARLVLGGVAPVPWQCKSTEELLAGKRIDAETIRAAQEDALRGAEPLEQNGYKIPLTQGLIHRALTKLADQS
jgi:xanthine dehydrogenase YagS FAD-binding subunit